MKVKVRLNNISKSANSKIELVFSSKPGSLTIKEIEKKGWKKTTNEIWVHRYNEKNLSYALSLSNRFININKKSNNNQKNRVDDYEEAFAYLRKKTCMRKKHDYCLHTAGAITTSVYDVRSRVVLSVS